MTKTMKNTLKSVVVMMVIAVVSVSLLAVANKFFPKYTPTLDEATVKLLNQVSPTGVSDSEAYGGGYFEMIDFASTEINLDDFNTEYGSGDTKVLAAYRALKGTNKDNIIVESQAKGRDDIIVMMTAYNQSAVITGCANKSNKESYWNKLPANVFDSLIGKSGEIQNGNAIQPSTGATMSLNGVAKAVSVANNMAAKLTGGIIVEEMPEVVTDAELLVNLKRASTSDSFMSYPVPKEDKNNIYGIYKGDKGDILVVGKGKGYQDQDMALLVTVTPENKVDKVIIIEHNEDFAGSPNSAGFASEFKNSLLINLFQGKSLEDVNGMTDIFAGTSGATLKKTPEGVLTCVKNAMGYYDKAAEIIASHSKEA